MGDEKAADAAKCGHQTPTIALEHDCEFNDIGYPEIPMHVIIKLNTLPANGRQLVHNSRGRNSPADGASLCSDCRARCDDMGKAKDILGWMTENSLRSMPHSSTLCFLDALRHVPDQIEQEL